jgi:nitrous oxide reductase accessory protein NosL
MKKTLLIMGALLFVTTGCNAEKSEIRKMPTRFQTVTINQAQLLQEGKDKMFCNVCGMNLPMFYKTNHATDIEGKKHQFCSIHCLAEIIEMGKKVDHIQVVNNEDLKFIDAKNAWYVVGSSKAGTMSKISKYAFSHKAKAQSFSKDFGGTVMDFNTTMSMVQKGLNKETALIKKKQSIMAKKGAMLYSKHCSTINKRFNSVAEAKVYIKNSQICTDIDGKKIQAVALYLFKK